MKRFAYALVVVLLLCGMTAMMTSCNFNFFDVFGGEDTTADNPDETTPTEETSRTPNVDIPEEDTLPEAQDTTAPEDDVEPPAEDVTEGDGESAGEEETVVYLTFSGTDVTSSVAGAVTVTDSIYLISKPGTYELAGELTDGQIRVQVAKTEDVTLVLNNFKAHCSFSAPLYIVSADEATIQMPEGTVNVFTDTAAYTHSLDTKPNACIYSSDDLTIRGKGSLKVTGLWNNGIGCKNDLVLRTGDITVSAYNNAIKGNGSVTIENGADILISEGDDGIKSDSLDAGKGFIRICEESFVVILCQNDALQATQDITVEAGSQVWYSCETPYQCDGTVNIADGSVNEQLEE